MLNVRLACDHLSGKLLFTWLSLVMSMMVSFVLSFFPRDVLDEILNLIESVSEDFPSYSSDESIGYVLSQLDSKGREHLVAYGGRALRNEELRWHITDKEGLALVEAVRQFRPYLANMPFTVYTDNVSVKWLQQIKNCQGRLGRWALL